MRSDGAVSSNAADGGFLTPVFGVAAVALSLVALATLQLARSDQVAARRHVERIQEYYRADGAAVRAAWRVLHTHETTALRWREEIGGQAFTVLAEPEMLKLSIAEAGGARGRDKLRALFGDEIGARVASAAQTLAEDSVEPPSRDQIGALDASPDWRTCGASVVSAFSRLTDTALASPRGPSHDPYRPRAGEVWRLVVASDRRVLVDRLVRFTGGQDEPIALVETADTAGAPLQILQCDDRLKLS